MTDRELMQQAMEALESDNPDIQLRAAIALRQALETEREWVGLADDEAFKILDNVLGFNTSFGLETNFVRAFARAIESKLKEKNA